MMVELSGRGGSLCPPIDVVVQSCHNEATITEHTSHYPIHITPKIYSINEEER
jgi:hypothetical protein